MNKTKLFVDTKEHKIFAEKFHEKIYKTSIIKILMRN